MAFLTIEQIMPPGRMPAAGVRIAGTPAAIRLEELCDGKPAYYLGEELRTEAVDPNWREALDQAYELILRSADLGVLMRLAAACLRQRSLSEFRDCLGLVADLLEQHWHVCYPELEVDEDGDPPDASVRIGVLGRFEDERLILEPLQEARIADEGLLDGELALSSLTRGHVSTAVMHHAIHIMDDLLQTAERIERAVASQSHQDADFSIYRFKEKCSDVRRTLVTASSGQAEAAATNDGTAQGNPTNALNELSAGVTPARGRELATAQIRAIIRYLEMAEPSSPVIGVLGRALDLIGKDFWQLMEELGEQRLVDAAGEARLFAKKS